MLIIYVISFHHFRVHGNLFESIVQLAIFYLGHAIGRQAFLTHSVIRPLSTLFDDAEDIVRKNTHLAMEMASECTMGTSLFLTFSQIFLCKIT